MSDRITEATMSRLQHLMALREDAEALGSPAAGGAWAPAADWYDLGSHLLLLLDVPAAEPTSLELHEDGDEVTIAGERAAWPGSGAALSSERFAGPFSRTLRFPAPVLPGSGEASLEAGVLRVQFAKRCPTIDAPSCRGES